MDAEVVEQEPARAAPRRRGRTSSEERVHRHRLLHRLDRVRVRRLERRDRPRVRAALRLLVAARVVAVEALAVALGARLGVRLLVLGAGARDFVHAAEHLERLVVERVDAGGVDLHARVERARGLLEVRLPVLVLAVRDDLADVVDQRERPRVLGVDLVLARELDAVAVQVQHRVRAEDRAALRRAARSPRSRSSSSAITPRACARRSSRTTRRSRRRGPRPGRPRTSASASRTPGERASRGASRARRCSGSASPRARGGGTSAASCSSSSCRWGCGSARRGRPSRQLKRARAKGEERGCDEVRRGATARRMGRARTRTTRGEERERTRTFTHEAGPVHAKRGDGRRASVARASWGMAPRRGVGVPTVTKRPRALRSKKEETLGGYETLRSTTLSVWRNLAKFPAKQSTTSVRMGKHTGRSIGESVQLSRQCTQKNITSGAQR